LNNDFVCFHELGSLGESILAMSNSV
jgi:hypothetical protein